MKLTTKTALKGEVTIPGDKSISHRSIMFGSIADGTTEVTHFLEGADCLSTISCFQKMGIEIHREKDMVTIKGKGVHGLNAPTGISGVGKTGKQETRNGSRPAF